MRFILCCVTSDLSDNLTEMRQTSWKTRLHTPKKLVMHTSVVSVSIPSTLRSLREPSHVRPHFLVWVWGEGWVNSYWSGVKVRLTAASHSGGRAIVAGLGRGALQYLLVWGYGSTVAQGEGHVYGCWSRGQQLLVWGNRMGQQSKVNRPPPTEQN